MLRQAALAVARTTFSGVSLVAAAVGLTVLARAEAGPEPTADREAACA